MIAFELTVEVGAVGKAKFAGHPLDLPPSEHTPVGLAQPQFIEPLLRRPPKRCHEILFQPALANTAQLRQCARAESRPIGQ